MNYSFLLFRCKQIGRYIKQTGAIYIILPILLLSGTLLQGIENLTLFSNHNLILLYLLLVIALLYQRTDYDFLNHSEQPLATFYLVDTGLITIPFCILYVAIGKWQAALGILFVGLFTSLLWPNIASVLSTRNIRSTALRTDVPFVDLELKFIARKYGVFLSFIYIIALVFSGYIATIFIITFIFLVLFQSALEYFEPKEMIFYHESATQFLHGKIFRLWLTIQLLLLPFYLIGLFAAFDAWYLFLLVFIASSIMIFFFYLQ